jgi:predicted metal-binding protein
MCPPRSPTPDQTRKVLDSFEEALLIHCDDEPDISKIALALEREAFLSGFYKAFAMGAGPCELCSSCNTKGSCRHPYEARPSMEASGIDVFHTVRNNGFHIEVLTSPANRANYFGLVLIE